MQLSCDITDISGMLNVVFVLLEPNIAVLVLISLLKLASYKSDIFIRLVSLMLSPSCACFPSLLHHISHSIPLVHTYMCTVLLLQGHIQAG